ncbi:pyrroline-5-carboxylate reductase [Loktanella sp. D2R18]|nr:pyrroline-5-carboxylate reductase [Loktanella sp. D2R18]
MIGCGFMGQAMLEGWMAKGVKAHAIHVQDPQPSDWVLAQAGISVNAPLPNSPAVLVIAVKPQMLAQVLPDLSDFGGGETLVLTIVTGYPLSTYDAAFGTGTPVVRVMPNLPSAVGAGVSAYACNTFVDDHRQHLTNALLGAVGVAIPLADEDQLHAVTGISGSGPAYVFAMAEAMAEAGEAMGLPAELAATLALYTITGASQMMRESAAPPSDLRDAVTSKGGTTAQALQVLMKPDTGLFNLMKKASQASRDRSLELGE